MPHPPVPDEWLEQVRLYCLDLPEATEEQAWTGVRWCVGKKNFAHVLLIDEGWPPAYAEAAQTAGPACVLTFRLGPDRIDAARYARPPFFRPVWFPNIVGRRIDDDTDWDEVKELLVESYLVLAPKRLAVRVRELG